MGHRKLFCKKKKNQQDDLLISRGAANANVSRYEVHAIGHHKLFCEKNLYPLILKKHTHIIYRWKANWL